jgi:integrase/recombinase XerD
MDWKPRIEEFRRYLKLERGLSNNTVSSYTHDIQNLASYCESFGKSTTSVGIEDIRGFLEQMQSSGQQASSQARFISSLRSFFGYLYSEELIDSDPTELLESPKLGRKLPDTLSVDEIEAIIDQIDLSSSTGQRDRAMIEVLYGCGLRVSELIELRISHVYFKEEFIRILGKGNKERLVPIGHQALKHLKIYIKEVRSHGKIDPKYTDHVFLNHFGRRISRVSVFHLVKKLTQQAGIKKNISPHTFRHSFASHLVDAGADLRAVQNLLGHESITTTEIYTHLDRAYLRAAIENHPRS